MRVPLQEDRNGEAGQGYGVRQKTLTEISMDSGITRSTTRSPKIVCKKQECSSKSWIREGDMARVLSFWSASRVTFDRPSAGLGILYLSSQLRVGGREASGQQLFSRQSRRIQTAKKSSPDDRRRRRLGSRSGRAAASPVAILPSRRLV